MKYMLCMKMFEKKTLTISSTFKGYYDVSGLINMQRTKSFSISSLFIFSFFFFFPVSKTLKDVSFLYLFVVPFTHVIRALDYFRGPLPIAEKEIRVILRQKGEF